VQESPVGRRGTLPAELLDGLRSWGYVRDLDQSQQATPR
jgi:hypothetical protein